MRKLFLASVVFKVGATEHHEYRLVIADVDNSMKDMEQRERATSIGVNEWRNEAKGTDRVLSGLSVNSVLEDGKSYELPFYRTEFSKLDFPVDKKPVVFVSAYGPAEFPAVDEEQSDDEEKVSVHVLIDIDGTKQYFDTGWYNYTDQSWCNCNQEFSKQIAKNEFKWFYIPQ